MLWGDSVGTVFVGPSLCTTPPHPLQTAVTLTNFNLLHILSLSLSLSLSTCSPAERTEEDIELIYDELIHIGPFRHLSNAVSLTIIYLMR